MCLYLDYWDGLLGANFSLAFCKFVVSYHLGTKCRASRDLHLPVLIQEKRGQTQLETKVNRTTKLSSTVKECKMGENQWLVLTGERVQRAAACEVSSASPLPAPPVVKVEVERRHVEAGLLRRELQPAGVRRVVGRLPRHHARRVVGRRRQAQRGRGGQGRRRADGRRRHRARAVIGAVVSAASHLGLLVIITVA